MHTDRLPAEYHAPLVEDLCGLIRIPSRSSLAGGEEGPIQARVLERLRAGGARVRSFEADDLPGFRGHPLCHGPERDYRGRPTVVGEIGPAAAPALIVLAHSDTVPVTRPAEWTFDPFVGDVHDGHIRGLGAGDDKWGTAMLLTILRALRDSGRPLRKRLILASTVDEEHGVGNGLLLLMLAGVRAEAALYLDGGDLQVCIGNLGGSVLDLRPRRPRSADQAARQTARLQAACRAASLERRPLFERDVYRKNLARDQGVAFHAVEDPGGPYYRVVFYLFPEDDRARFRRELEARLTAALGPDADHFVFQYWEPWFEPTLIPRDTPLIGHLASAVAEHARRDPEITTISMQDSFIFNKYAGIPTVSFGPQHLTGHGYHHQPDEYLAVEDAWTGARAAYAAVCRWLET